MFPESVFREERNITEASSLRYKHSITHYRSPEERIRGSRAVPQPPRARRPPGTPVRWRGRGDAGRGRGAVRAGAGAGAGQSGRRAGASAREEGKRAGAARVSPRLPQRRLQFRASALPPGVSGRVAGPDFLRGSPALWSSPSATRTRLRAPPSLGSSALPAAQVVPRLSAWCPRAVWGAAPAGALHPGPAAVMLRLPPLAAGADSGRRQEPEPEPEPERARRWPGTPPSLVLGLPAAAGERRPARMRRGGCAPASAQPSALCSLRAPACPRAPAAGPGAHASPAQARDAAAPRRRRRWRRPAWRAGGPDPERGGLRDLGRRRQPEPRGSRACRSRPASPQGRAARSQRLSPTCSPPPAATGRVERRSSPFHGLLGSFVPGPGLPRPLPSPPRIPLPASHSFRPLLPLSSFSRFPQSLPRGPRCSPGQGAFQYIHGSLGPGRCPCKVRPECSPSCRPGRGRCSGMDDAGLQSLAASPHLLLPVRLASTSSMWLPGIGKH